MNKSEIHFIKIDGKELVGRKCNTCGEIKPLSEFRNNPAGFLGKKTICKNCQDSYLQEYRSSEEVKKKQADYQRKSKYGITPEQYAEMYIAQEGKCLICKEICTELKVDHNHETGKIRALLCNNCNAGIAFFGENIELMNEAIKYILRFLENKNGIS